MLPAAARRKIVHGMMQIIRQYRGQELPFYPTGVPALRLIAAISKLVTPHIEDEVLAAAIGVQLCDFVHDVLKDPDAININHTPRLSYWKRLVEILDGKFVNYPRTLH